MPRTRSSSLEHPHLKFTRPSRHMTSRPSCLMITRPPRLTTTRPPRLMTPRPPRLRLGPAIPMTRSSSLGQALQNSKFLVPVDGSQQTLFRSSPAGTHRTLVRTYFQNPASPSSNFSKMQPHEHNSYPWTRALPFNVNHLWSCIAPVFLRIPLVET